MLIEIIDDDVDIAETLEIFLKQQGHQVLKAFTAKDGLKIFTLKMPDAVFLDIQLPDRSGIDLLKDIKTISSETSVIMITGYKDAENVIASFRRGAFDCLLKPFNMDYLKTEILPKIPSRKR